VASIIILNTPPDCLLLQETGVDGCRPIGRKITLGLHPVVQLSKIGAAAVFSGEFHL
jgi:hypothetical protein